MEKTFDRKLARLRSDSSCRDFILADAKDADMALGIHGLGSTAGGDGNDDRPRSLNEYRQCIREIAQQGLVDIMLMSVSMSDRLTIHEKIFADSAITPAIRANDATDIWLVGTTARYSSQSSLPFRTASLDHAMGGRENCLPEERARGADLGLYSVTLNNDAERDSHTLTAYAEFRREAEQKGFRHFLEVFPPNAGHGLQPEDIPRFVNDSIVRLLAGVAPAGRPQFLKIPYFGPRAMETLATYDSSLIVGILGGATGTTFESFHMVWEAKQYGARAALFGRRINSAEHQPSFVEFLRRVADDELAPKEAVRAYHAELDRRKIPAQRSLEDDSRLEPFR